VGSRKRPNSAALSGSQTKAPGFAGGYLLAALCYWGLHGSMNERGGVFWLVLFGIVVTFCVAAELLRRSGMPLFERAPHAS
jgi:hypothetical protein